MAKRDFEAFRKTMEQAAKDCGVLLEMGKITYGDETFRFSAKCYNANDIVSAKREEFDRYCGKKDIPSHWYMQRFVEGGDTYEIFGILPRGRKNVLKIRNVVTGKEYMCEKGYVTNFISDTKAIAQNGGILV